jgi:hypothetical protein
MGGPDLPDSRDHAQPCRPTISCTAEIVAPGDFELETGGAYAHASGLDQRNLPFLLKQGFFPWLEGQVGSNGYTNITGTTRAFFLDNIFVGPKVHFTGESKFVPSLALTSQISLPTASATGYVRRTNAFFVAHASKDFKPLHVDANFGESLWHLDGPLQAQEFVAVAVTASLPANFSAILEGYFFSDAPPAAPEDGGLRPAVTFAAKSWLVVDAGGDIGFFPATRGFTVFAGVTMIPIVFWRTASTERAASP